MNPRALLSFLLCALASGSAYASDPVGVYANVGKVVLEPSDAAPERIRVCGAFSVAVPMSGGKYSSPQSGYFYYACNAAELAACRMAFADIKKAAGAGGCIGFGDRYGQNGKVRTALPPGAPDPYPTGIGVVTKPSNTVDSMDACKQVATAVNMHDACKDPVVPTPPDMATPVVVGGGGGGSKGCSAVPGAAAAPPASLLLLGLSLAFTFARRRRAR